MTQSLDLIAALVASNTALKEYYEGAKGDLQQAAADLPSKIFTRLYVDEDNGLPGNSGAVDQPFESIAAALATVHRGQNVELRLLSDAQWTTRTNLFSVDIRILGSTTTNAVARRQLVFAPEASNVAGQVPGGSCWGATTMVFQSVDLVLAQDVGITTAHFLPVGQLHIGMLDTSIVGTHGNAPLIGQNAGFFSLRIDQGSVTDMEGRWVLGRAAGTPLDVATIGGVMDPNIVN